MLAARASLLALCLAACASQPTGMSLGPPPSDPDTPYPAGCVDNMGRFMNMSYEAFDQDFSGGWRTIAKTDGCTPAAARLIADYRNYAMLGDVRSLYWHEAQLRASMGETAAALDLFRITLAMERHLAGPDDQTDTFYNEATIAFLEGDRAKLLSARASLAAVPKPDGFEEGAEEFRKKYPEAPPLVWPNNLNVVDGLIACFDKPYKEAYSSACNDWPKD